MKLHRYATLAAAIGSLLAATAAAQELDSCFQVCSSESGAHDCRFDAQEARELCVEENGCGALRRDYFGACFGESPEQAACDEARASFRECVTPCHEELRTRMDLCRDQVTSCLEERCGIELPDPGADLHFRHRLDP